MMDFLEKCIKDLVDPNCKNILLKTTYSYPFKEDDIAKAGQNGLFCYMGPFGKITPETIDVTSGYRFVLLPASETIKPNYIRDIANETLHEITRSIVIPRKNVVECEALTQVQYDIYRNMYSDKVDSIKVSNTSQEIPATSGA